MRTTIDIIHDDSSQFYISGSIEFHKTGLFLSVKLSCSIYWCQIYNSRFTYSPQQINKEAMSKMERINPISENNKNQTRNDLSSLTLSSTRRKKIERTKSKNNIQSDSISKLKSRKNHRSGSFKLHGSLILETITGKQKDTVQLGRQKQRKPTPCKSRKLLEETNSTQKKDVGNKTLEVEYEIQRQGLYNVITELKINQERLKEKINLLQQSNNQISDELQDLRLQCSQWKFQSEQACHRIVYLQKSILDTQTNLESQKVKFDELKQSIKNTQILNLKTEIKQLEQKNETILNQKQVINKKLCQLASQFNKLQQKYQNLERTTASTIKRQHYLQEQLGNLRQANIKDGVFLDLEKQLRALLEQNEIMKAENKKLHLDLDFLHRKNIDEYKICIKTKNEVIKNLKSKFDQSKTEIQKLRKQLKEVKKKKHDVKNIRESIMTSDHKRPEIICAEQIELELSPDSNH